MKRIPGFSIEEDWCGKGNVTIYFDNEVEINLHNYFAIELEKVVSKMPMKERTVLALEKAIIEIFERVL